MAAIVMRTQELCIIAALTITSIFRPKEALQYFGRNRKALTAASCGRKTDRNSYGRTLVCMHQSFHMYGISSHMLGNLLGCYIKVTLLCNVKSKEVQHREGT